MGKVTSGRGGKGAAGQAMIGVSELARMVGRHRGSVDRWHRRGDWPREFGRPPWPADKIPAIRQWLAENIDPDNAAEYRREVAALSRGSGAAGGAGGQVGVVDPELEQADADAEEAVARVQVVLGLSTPGDVGRRLKSLGGEFAWAAGHLDADGLAEVGRLWAGVTIAAMLELGLVSDLRPADWRAAIQGAPRQFSRIWLGGLVSSLGDLLRRRRPDLLPEGGAGPGDGDERGDEHGDDQAGADQVEAAGPAGAGVAGGGVPAAGGVPAGAAGDPAPTGGRSGRPGRPPARRTRR